MSASFSLRNGIGFHFCIGMRLGFVLFSAHSVCGAHGNLLSLCCKIGGWCGCLDYRTGVCLSSHVTGFVGVNGDSLGDGFVDFSDVIGGVDDCSICLHFTNQNQKKRQEK